MNPLTQYIQEKRQQKPILSMTHVIYGYPTVKDSLEWMTTLLENGADFLEVQFPFSDPVADGPSIVAACHKALEQPLSVESCLSHIGQLARDFPESRIVLMSYLNPMYRYGLEKLAKRSEQEGILGLILPDLPIEQAGTYRAACEAHNIEPIWLVTPSTPSQRLEEITSQSKGFLYCVARSGVTGHSSYEKEAHEKEPNKEHINTFSLDAYLNQIKAHTDTPLGVGFGIRERQQIEQLTGKVDVAILGSALLDAYNQGGAEAGITLFKQLFHA